MWIMQNRTDQSATGGYRRLKEEKKGDSIDLGFAPFRLPRTPGVVDVPGHEKFIHNMLESAGLTL